MLDPDRVARRILVGGDVGDRRRIEHNEVGVGSFSKHAAIAQADLGGRHRRELLDRRLEWERPALADICAEDAAGRAVCPRMGPSNIEDRVSRMCAAAKYQPSVKAGISRCATLPEPEEGNQPR